jgi:hypothetical protein
LIDAEALFGGNLKAKFFHRLSLFSLFLWAVWASRTSPHRRKQKNTSFSYFLPLAFLFFWTFQDIWRKMPSSMERILCVCCKSTSTPKYYLLGENGLLVNNLVFPPNKQPHFKDNHPGKKAKHRRGKEVLRFHSVFILFFILFFVYVFALLLFSFSLIFGFFLSA